MKRNLFTRREVMASGAAAFAGAALSHGARAQDAAHNHAGTQAAGADAAAARTTTPHEDGPTLEPGQPGRDYNPVVTPNGWTLPFHVVDGVKVFHMTAEEVNGHEFAEGLVCDVWGYNGSCHGPTIEAVEGDHIRIYVTNKLRAPTTIHWHGLLLPAGMDGVGGLNQRAIKSGETFVYEFPLKQHGTFMYHSHHDEMTQAAMGMVGMFIIHPRGVPVEDRPHRDFAIMLAEWAIEPGARKPDPNVMSDFNVLTMNARCFPGTQPLIAKRNDRVRIRLGNLSMMDHHPIHLHGYEFPIVGIDGNDVPKELQQKRATVLVAVGETRDIEFIAENPGDWAMHCHMFHHVMNQMGHDIPNMVGVDPQKLDAKVRPLVPAYMTMGQDGMGDMGDMGMAVPHNSIPMVGAQGPFDYITMGGMFTILKVHESLPNGYDVDPGWYENPPRTVAWPATDDELRHHGIAADGSTAPRPPANVRQASRQAPPPPGSDVAPGNAPHAHGGHGAAPAVSAAQFTCPMHPEVVSDQPGRCPKCGMKLIPKN